MSQVQNVKSLKTFAIATLREASFGVYALLRFVRNDIVWSFRADLLSIKIELLYLPVVFGLRAVVKGCFHVPKLSGWTALLEGRTVGFVS